MSIQVEKLIKDFEKRINKRLDGIEHDISELKSELERSQNSIAFNLGAKKLPFPQTMSWEEYDNSIPVIGNNNEEQK